MKPSAPPPATTLAMRSASKMLRRNPPLRLLLFAAAALSLFLLLAPHYPSPGAFPFAASLSNAARARQQQQQKFFTAAPKPRPAPADVCLVIGHDRAAPDVWRFNSRSLCVTSPMCMASAPSRQRDVLVSIIHTSDFAKTTCRIVTPSFNNLPYVPERVPHFSHHAPSCAAFHQRYAACPLNGTGMKAFYGCLADRASTPAQLAAAERIGYVEELATADDGPGGEDDVDEEDGGDFRSDEDEEPLVLHGVTLVVPNYPYTQNIYHFLNVATFLTDVSVNLPTILAHYGADKLRPPDALSRHPLNVLLLNAPTRHEWQSALLTALLRARLPRASPTSRINVVYAQQVDQPRICVRNPVLFGRRGHVNVWPFANASAVLEDASAVPVSAVRFREDVYAALRVPGIARNPVITRSLDVPASGHAAGARLSLPPRVLGYARRPGRAAVVTGNVHAAGTVRRFRPEDEEWFDAMLLDETKSAGFTLQSFTIGANETLGHQAARFAALGVLVGIHGANLVNAVFMRPLAAMIEIFPARVASPCYIAGLNSGLRYWKHVAEEMATPEESGCTKDEKRCWLLPRQRMVKLATRTDRERVRQLVRDAIAYVNKLHTDHADGVPVRHDEADGVYRRVG